MLTAGHGHQPDVNRPPLLLVSPRPPRRDGQGDQRRAHVALTALSRDWAVEVVSWLPDADEALARSWRARPACLLRAIALSLRLPIHVAYVQSLAPRSIVKRIRSSQSALFMTNRAVPPSSNGLYAIDFIDDLGGAAIRRASTSGRLLSWFWRFEGRRMRRLDSRLAAGAVLSLAISEQDASALSPLVRTIPADIPTAPMPDVGTKIAFTGNLFYAPNLEAATWICETLAPQLVERGVAPDTIVIAGRRPPKPLRDKAAAAGVDLRADVADLAETLREAAVVLSPVIFGSGVQHKVLDAVGACRACVLTPFTNKPLGLEDGHSALVRDRSEASFADGIVALLDEPASRQLLTSNALQKFMAYTDEGVSNAWRRAFRDVRDALTGSEFHIPQQSLQGDNFTPTGAADAVPSEQPLAREPDRPSSQRGGT